MKQSLEKNTLMIALITGSVIWGGTSVYAEEPEQVFTLDPMIVTAQGFETKDLDTPAAVEVYDVKRIEESGANNAFDVLQNTLGVTVQSQGFNGAAMGTMTSKIMIRGAQVGTLVLLNGVPMNMDGKYNLEDIPSGAIEKIEVVRGGGSVLYGSEATGGVINIITKKKINNKVKFSAGNFGKERYDISLGTDKFSVVAGLENRGKADGISSLADGKTTGSIFDYGKGERKSVMWNYQITDGLIFTHNYSKNEHRYMQKDAVSKKYTELRDYYDTDNNFLVSYDKDGWKAHVSYGTQEKTYDKISPSGNGWKNPTLNSWRKGHNTNLNIQKKFDIGQNSLLVGAGFQKEDMDLRGTSNSMSYDRNNYSLYLSYDMSLDEKQNLLFNMRETWAVGSKATETKKDGTKVTTENEDLSKFTPEVQYIYKVNENSSFYAKAGKSFRMPNLTQIYGTSNILPTTDLKPEQGTHYEIGYKLNENKRSWRVALYSYDIKDYLKAARDKNDDIYYVNQDFRNTGIELSCTTVHDKNWSSNIGLTYSKPQARNEEEYGDLGWHDCYGRYQINGTLNYNKNKFNGMLSGNFVGHRISNTATERNIKPQFFTDLDLSYKPEDNHKIFFHLNNILDRIDITTNGDTNYHNLGRNFMLGYEYSF